MIKRKVDNFIFEKESYEIRGAFFNVYNTLGGGIIEIKSKPFITVEDKKQFWRYLKNSNYELGFLVNFSPKRLEINRFADIKLFKH